MNCSVVFITAGNNKEAEFIANQIIESKLAACVNIIPQIKSIYRWKNNIEKNKEVLLIVKTRESLLDSLKNKVKKIHSYSCPEIISFPIKYGNDDYLKWIIQET